jgi:hypothetical protein
MRWDGGGEAVAVVVFMKVTVPAQSAVRRRNGHFGIGYFFGLFLSPCFCRAASY